MKGKHILKSDFVKPVAMLFSGTALAKGLGFLLMPVITRLFTPEEFGEFGMLMRIVGVIAVVGTAAYEFAIPLPKRREHAFHIYQVTLRILCWVVGLTFLLGLLFWVFEGGNRSILFYVIFIVSISTFTIFINIGRHWAIREKNFKQITYSNLIQSGGANMTKLLTGFGGMGFVGLALGALIGVIGGGILYFRTGVRLFRDKTLQVSKLRRKAMIREYQDFPRMELPNTFVSNIKLLLISVFLTTYFGSELYGSYDHAFRMLTIPMLLIGTAISQVLYSQMAERYAHKNPIYPLFVKSALLLFVGGIILYTVLYFWGVSIFTFVFGQEWGVSGEIASSISPYALALFVASPLSIVPSVIRELKWFFWVAVGTAGVELLCYGFLPQIMSFWGCSTMQALLGIACITFCCHFGVTLWMAKIVKKKDELNCEKSNSD